MGNGGFSMMRNFFLIVGLTIDPRLGRFTFDEILEKVYPYNNGFLFHIVETF